MRRSKGAAPNGNLTSMRYGFGRIVTYGYGIGALKDRIDSVSFSYFHSDGGVEDRQLVTNVAWEPYGGLRKYRVEPEEIWVDYEHGAATAPPASRCASGALNETVDQTGRLRSLRVSSASRETYRRTYTWRADQVERIDTCYLGGGDAGSEYLSEVYSADAGAGFGYDGLGRLKGGVSPTFATMGGPWAERKYEYDARGNITHLTADGTDYEYTLDTSSANRRDWVTSFGADSWNKLDFTHDNDGRIVSIAGPLDSSLNPSTSSALDYTSTFGPGSETVMRGVTVSTGNGSSVGYTYVYDMMSRRSASMGPVGMTAFFYDLGHQLLETWSLNLSVNSLVEDFIWLDGRPIAAIRSRVDDDDPDPEHLGQLAHLIGDESGDCSRNDDGVPCGIYFIVTDHIGKPVLALDSQGRITGVGEYEPRGLINRVQMVEQTPHPYEKTSSAMTFYTMEQKALGGLDVRFRAHFPMVDTEEDCSGVIQEGVGVWSADELSLRETIGGYSKGDVWTHWWLGDDVSGLRRLKLGWGRVAGNCYGQALDPGCTVACPLSSGNGWDYSGFVLREYEYARTEVGASPYFPNLRFPGHYWDAETDLHENWHRYYSPLIGYLSPEPLLRSPGFVLSSAASGRPSPSYSYAANNPVSNTDPTGLWTLNGRCDGFSTAISLARQWLGCDGGASQSSPSDLTCGGTPNSCAAAKACFASCDVCSVLSIGTWPTITPVGPKKRPKGPAGAYYAQWTDPWVESDGTYTTASGGQWDLYQWQCGNPQVLATTLIHEATHSCAVGASPAQAAAFADDDRRPCTGWSVECACVPSAYRSKACR